MPSRSDAFLDNFAVQCLGQHCACSHFHCYLQSGCIRRTSSDVHVLVRVQEIQLLRRISFDRNIVQFYGACLESQPPMLVMEYMAVSPPFSVFACPSCKTIVMWQCSSFANQPTQKQPVLDAMFLYAARHSYTASLYVSRYGSSQRSNWPAGRRPVQRAAQ